MSHYVIISVVVRNHILLVLKDKPLWMSGLLNLPGGKVEEGEDPTAAAIRELYEEAGLTSLYMTKMGEIHDGNNIIHCFKAVVKSMDLAPQESETQEITWQFMGDAMSDNRLIPNLRVIVPLIESGVTGWFITDNYRGANNPVHEISITIPTYRSHDSSANCS